MIRLGLCCIFKKEPISFRSVTAKTLAAMARDEQLQRLSAICLHNAKNLLAALSFIQEKGMGAFRISSGFFPRCTHPEVGYWVDDLPEGETIRSELHAARQFAASHGLRLSFHPDQFIILSSPHTHVVESSMRELEYHGKLAEIVGAEIINVHVGGHYGDKRAALDRFSRNFHRLSSAVQQRLTVENDDLIYSVVDVLPLCERLGIPLVYDVHHHRCLPDDYTVEEATAAVTGIWRRHGRLPYFHLSSAKFGWQKKIRSHADYIDVEDFPKCWQSLDCTIDIEAKAKELAVLRLMQELRESGLEV